MQIECVLKRQGGTKVTIDKTEYHFTEQADGAHVATVDNDEHLQRFLGIPEGYKVYRAAKAVEKAPESKPAEEKKPDADPVEAKPVAKKAVKK